MKHLSLHGVEEGFNEGVVGDLAWAVHALREAQLGKALLEGTSGILGAPIGVEYEAATGVTAAHGAIERFEGELHILPGAIAPTDNAPAVLVHDHRQEAVDRADLEVRSRPPGRRYDRRNKVRRFRGSGWAALLEHNVI